LNDKTTEIRLHGRGGQGVKTASLLLAEAAIEGGKYVQGFSDYGPERAGAPVQGFTRISDEPIRLHNFITEPDVIIVLDPTLIGSIDITDGMCGKSGKVLVNTPEDPATMAEKLGVSPGCVWTVDATQISLDEMGRNIPNSPMMGLFVKATGLMELDWIEATFTKKFSKKDPKIVVGNVKAISRAFEEAKNG
jgi:pyruvate ferredoxin oxidoreductase gamma subunit